MKGAIYEKGKKGQIVVLDGVSFGEDSKDPLAKYLQPSFFLITETKYISDVSRDKEYLTYILKDTYGNELTVSAEEGWWLVDINEWTKEQKHKHESLIKSKEKEIEKLQHQIEILIEVLNQHEVKFITEKQAKEIGLQE